jgi:vancomycin resistance protein YoaR
MTKPPQRPPRRRKKKEPLAILILALLVALVAWPFEKLFGRGGGRSRGRARFVVVLVVAIVLALLVAAVAFDAASAGDTIHRNITVNGVAVGGLTVAGATQKLEGVALRHGGVTLSRGGSHWTLTAAALHARLRAKAAARSAYAYTRTGNFVARAWRHLGLLFAGHPVAAAVTFAEPLTRERLDAISHAVDVKPVQGAVTISGSQPVVREAKDGRAVDQAAIVRLLSGAALAGRTVSTALPVLTLSPEVSTDDARTAAATARTWLAGSLSITHGSHTWAIRRQELGQYLSFVREKGEPRLRPTFDSPVTRGYFDYITQRVGKPGKDATFTTTSNGKRVRVKHGTSGYGVVPKATIANMNAAAAAGGSRVAQAVFGTAPPILSDSDAKAMHITTRIGTYTTSVAGTSNRLTNVSLGSSLMNNTLIAPGKIFSVNATTGERTAAKGFKMAPTIIAGKLEDTVGGGMCQVSTTVFNAAFEAGLQIVERHNHELYISHYPLARDATVSYGSYDLKFRNDTPNWILLKTSFTGWSLTVSLYSSPLHRHVVSSTGTWYGLVPFSVHKQNDPTLDKGKTKIDTPGVGGMSIDCFRKVYDKTGKLLWNDDFKSVYSMVPEVLLVGTKKTASSSPTPKPSGSSSATPTPKPSST